MATAKAAARSFRGLRQELGALPITVSQAIAQRAAPELTRRARAAYLSGKTAYGDDRPEGVDGAALTLMRTGATFRTLRFVQSGTIVRCALGTRYAKYLIGKYRVLPVGDLTAMPAAWARAIDQIVADEVSRRAQAAFARAA